MVFEGFLGFLESTDFLMDSKVLKEEILKAVHHLILNSLAKCMGK